MSINLEVKCFLGRETTLYGPSQVRCQGWDLREALVVSGASLLGHWTRTVGCGTYSIDTD